VDFSFRVSRRSHPNARLPLVSKAGSRCHRNMGRHKTAAPTAHLGIVVDSDDSLRLKPRSQAKLFLRAKRPELNGGTRIGGAQHHHSAPRCAKRGPRPSGWERRGQVLGVRKGRGLAQSATKATDRATARFLRGPRQTSTVSFRQRVASKRPRFAPSLTHIFILIPSRIVLVPRCGGALCFYLLTVLQELGHALSAMRPAQSLRKCKL
jgi:hypothetical protein